MFKELFYTTVLALCAIIWNVYRSELDTLLYEQKGDPVEINSVYGKLKGQTGFTRGGRRIEKFISIPYAKPPMGQLRFEPPLSYGKWDGTLDATKTSPACAQYDFIWQKLTGQEDCLFLNIYTPSLPKKRNNGKTKYPLLPVMVYFHGGHFMFGSHHIYNPDYFLDEDVILVTLNYRLNVLGFLNTGDAVVSGNQGMKDQVLALKWVNEAIKDFGGDPNRVTIFGNSAGGMSTTYHLHSNMSKGLFHRGISQSGTSLSVIGFMRDPKRHAIRFGKKVGCPTEDSRELVQCLKLLPFEDLIRVHEEMHDVFYDFEASFVPSKEYVDIDEVGADNVFLSDYPSKLMKEGKFFKVPWIYGVVKDEGCFRSPMIVNDEMKLNQLNHNWSSISDNLFHLSTTAAPKTASDKIREEYFPPGNKKNEPDSSLKQMKLITKEDISDISNLFGDRYFIEGCRASAIYHSKHAPAYSYIFTKKPDIGYGMIMDCTRGLLPPKVGSVVGYLKYLLYDKMGWQMEDYGVCHTDELQYFFKIAPQLYISKDSPDFQFSESLVKLWVSFAKNGQPDRFQGVEWIKAENEDEMKSLNYLEIGEQSKMIPEPFTSRLLFWESLGLTPTT